MNEAADSAGGFDPIFESIMMLLLLSFSETTNTHTYSSTLARDVLTANQDDLPFVIWHQGRQDG